MKRMVMRWAPPGVGGLLASSFRALSCMPSAPSSACRPFPSSQVGRGSGGGVAGRGVAARIVAPMVAMTATAAATKTITVTMRAAMMRWRTSNDGGDDGGEVGGGGERGVGVVALLVPGPSPGGYSAPNPSVGIGAM